MLLQVSYFSKEKKELIDYTVGIPYGLMKRLSIGGIGSQRFIVDSSNKEIDDLFASQTGTRFCNIELRPNGVIIWFRVKIDNWILVMPYDDLTMDVEGNMLKFCSGDWKINLEPAHNARLNTKFINKMLLLKALNE